MLTRWPTRSFFHPDFEAFFRAPEAVAPAVDVTQDDEKFVLRAELPGVKAEEISIRAEKNRIAISGKRTIVHDDKATVRRRERGEGAFERSFTLPQPFDVEKIEASVVDGVLTVTVPKLAEAKPRQIVVKAGAS